MSVARGTNLACMVEMKLDALRVEIPSNNPLLLLQEKTGSKRTLVIYIGPAEAQAIAFAQQAISTPRPMTHDLIVDLIEALGATVELVVVTALRERTFYAELRLVTTRGRHSVSARPSDAVAIAVRANCPIFAEEDLLDAEGVILSSEEETSGDAELVSEFRNFIEGIRPEDFG